MDLEEPQRSVQRSWPRLEIFQGVAVAVGDNLIGQDVCWKSQEYPWCLAIKLLETWCRLRDPRRLLQIFGWGSFRSGLILELELRAVAAVRYYWPGTDVCWKYLVGVHVGWGIWFRIDVSWGHQCPLLESQGGHALWIYRESVDGIDNVFVSKYVWYPLSLSKGMP